MGKNFLFFCSLIFAFVVNTNSQVMRGDDAIFALHGDPFCKINHTSSSLNGALFSSESQQNSSSISRNESKIDDSNCITFIVGSDIHYKETNDQRRRYIKTTIDDMNALPGTVYPSSLGGAVKKPSFVAFCGDLTDGGKDFQIAAFEEDMGLKGEKRLKYPVYEGFGNHDSWGITNKEVRDFIACRNKERDHITEISDNGFHYGWEIEGIHFLQLNLYPGNEGDDKNFNNVGNKPFFSLTFLQQYLEKYVGRSGAPVVIFQHYGWDDFSMYGWGNGGWWSEGEREAFYDVIKNYNIIGIFWGHSHASNITKWRDIDVYNVGAMQQDEGPGTYMVCNISNNKMTVAVRCGSGKWNETSQKSISRPDPNGVTFYAISDIHYGLPHSSEYAFLNIDAMNNLLTTNYPSKIGGIINKPRGVIVAGDITTRSSESELLEYKTEFGLKGEKRLKFPVFDTWGNHDGNIVREEIKRRNLLRQGNIKISENGLHYSFEWDSIHIVCVGIYPGNEKIGGYDPFHSLDFLEKDLAFEVKNTGKPVIIFQHFGFGSHSLAPENWWKPEEAEAFYRVIKDYNIIAIIHGHEHDYFFGKWRGIDIINLPHYNENEGSGFCVFNIKGNLFKAAFYTTKQGWTDSFKKQISLGRVTINSKIKSQISIVEPSNL